MNGTPDGLVVRRASGRDAAAMSGSRSGDSESGPADRRMAAYLEGRHHPHQALEPRVAFLAEINGIAVGYVAGHLTRRFGCEGELQYLYVAPIHRRSGVAGELLRRLAEWFIEKRVRRICVNVDADSAGAEPFYSRKGAQSLRPYWMVWEDIGTVLRPGDDLRNTSSASVL